MEMYKELSKKFDEVENQLRTECENHLRAALAGHPESKISWNEGTPDEVGVYPPADEEGAPASAISIDGNNILWLHYKGHKKRLSQHTTSDIYDITDFVNELLA